jgi:hypothetical protein
MIERYALALSLEQEEQIHEEATSDQRLRGHERRKKKPSSCILA